jgi:diguanylate cyclase (GGDEF)-like protein
MARFGFLPARKKDSGEFDAPTGSGSAAAPSAGNQNGANDQRRSAGEALLLLQNFEESGQGWFWSTDASGRLTYLSASIARVLNQRTDTLVGSAFTDHFVRGDDGSGTHRTLPFILTRHSSFEKLTLRAATLDDERWWMVSGQAQLDASGTFTGYRGYGVDITEQLRSSEYASKLAMNDSLTGLPNRLAMSRALEAGLIAAEQQRRSCAVMLIDLDRFKQVNDTLGHPVGDALLKQVAERLLKIVGDKEKVFRLGGDEFKVILPNCDDRGALGDMANDIIASLSQPYSIQGSRCVIGASVGVAVGPADGRSSEELTRNVDLALYTAKGGGRGRFRFFSQDLLQAAEDQRVLEADLRDALVKGEISLRYQPVVNMRTNMVTGVEALIRWDHPQRGPISPALFVPIAEEANLIEPLGEWALRKACEDAASWPGTLRVAVNVSPVQFTNDSLPRIVTSALAASGLPANRLELELTEGVFLNETAETDSMFETLKSIGVRLALDDFGTGYSSLGYLKTAPFDKIKIDQSFVRGATIAGSRNGAIIAAIVALAGALDMETTAEGIETLDQLELIRRLGVSHVQGFVYSRAIGSEELSQRLGSGEWIIPPSGPARQRSDRQSMYRKVGAIVGNHYQQVLIRNLSESGALLDGLVEVPVGSHIMLDFGEGRLAVATVRRANKRQHGVEFGVPLVSDGEGGLCPGHRVSSYLLGMVGLSSASLSGGTQLWDADNADGLQELATRLGLDLSARPPQAALPAMGPGAGIGGGASGAIPTIEQFSARYLDHFERHPRTRHYVEHALSTHILPRFGGHLLNQMDQPAINSWLAAKTESEGLPLAAANRLRSILSYMYAMAQHWEVAGAESNPFQLPTARERDDGRRLFLNAEEIARLKRAVEEGHNPQLKNVVALLMLTGIRMPELLAAQWDDIDLDNGVWNIPASRSGAPGQLRLSAAAIEVIRQLQRWDDCPHLIANPRTRQPYRSFLKSWDSARRKAGLLHVSIEDLRYSVAKRW